MTLHVLDYSHIDFMATCFMAGGQDMQSAYARAYEEMDLAVAMPDPTFFVGPTAEAPRYFLGAYVDVTGRAHLTVGSVDLKSAPTYRDAVDWLGYLLVELGLTLVEAHVWVEDIKKEWFLRAVGFKKGGVIPDKVDIPGRGPQAALTMYIRPVDFAEVTPHTFRANINKYRAHRNRLREQRAAG